MLDELWVQHCLQPVRVVYTPDQDQNAALLEGDAHAKRGLSPEGTATKCARSPAYVCVRVCKTQMLPCVPSKRGSLFRCGFSGLC